MKFIFMKWLNAQDDEPIEIYSEIDEDRWETRKVEIYRDGTSTYARPGHSTGTTVLAEYPLPTIEKICSNPNFEAKEIRSREFEHIWTYAIGEKYVR